MSDQKKKFLLNTVTSILSLFITVVYNLILPRLILAQYGSAVNGLTGSITQFLSLITFSELGVGAVIRSALYKPLAEKNIAGVSAIITSGTKFFKRIALFLLGYVFVLIAVYPTLTNREFDWLFTASLIATISIDSFVNYYFGIINRLLLTADQRGYIINAIGICKVIVNALVSVVLIRLEVSIQILKLVVALISITGPFALMIYVNTHYQIDRHFKYEKEPIKQKWNGIAQHIAAIVLADADYVVLTCLSTLSNISIYMVYSLVVNGVKRLFEAVTAGIQSVIGELWAKQEQERLYRVFGTVEYCAHTVTILLFTCTAILIVPFVRVYTQGITDANYIQPLFALLLTMAHAGHCLRLPYDVMVRAAGHYKETQSNYIVSATMNVVISVFLVWKFGLIGVAIGTLAAMLYQTIWLAIYTSKNLIKRPVHIIIKQIVFDVLTASLIVSATIWIHLSSVSYFSWIIMACKVVGIALAITIIMSELFYRNQVKYLLGNYRKQR